MYCKKCGNKISNNTRFCDKCGEKVVDNNVKEKSVLSKKVVNSQNKNIICLVVCAIFVLAIISFTIGTLSKNKKDSNLVDNSINSSSKDRENSYSKESLKKKEEKDFPLSENIYKFENEIEVLMESDIPDTLVIRVGSYNDGEYYLVNSDGYILYQYEGKPSLGFNSVSTVYKTEIGGKTSLKKISLDSKGQCVSEDITDLILTNSSTSVEVVSGKDEPIIWVINEINMVDSFTYQMCAYDSEGVLIRSWEKSDFETDQFGSTYNPNDIFRNKNIRYIGDNAYRVQTNLSNESFVIFLDSDDIIIDGTSRYLSAYEGKIVKDFTCYDKDGNVLWNNDNLLLGENIIKNFVQYPNSDVIAYVQDDDIVLFNSDGSETARIPLISRLYSYDGSTKNCHYILIQYMNQGGKIYTTLYDEQGNMLYEPIEGDVIYESREPSFRKNGFLIIEKADGIFLVDSQGNEVKSLESGEFCWAGDKLFQLQKGKIEVFDSTN